jgi:hypothetical protein
MKINIIISVYKKITISYHVKHAFICKLKYSRYSYSWKEVLQNIKRCEINQKYHPMQWQVYMLLPAHSFLYSNLCSGIVGTGEVGTADMLGS